MPFLERPDARIHYSIWGEGAWVTLINGYSRGFSDFRPLASHLVRAGFRVLALDNRGAGQTETRGPFTVKTMAEDVARVWEAEGCTRSHVLGVSLGGMISIVLSAHFPGVDRLVLVSTPPTSQWAPPDDVLIEKYVAPAARERLGAILKSMAAVLGAPEPLPGLSVQKKEIQSWDGTPYFKRVRSPTLILHGAEDEIVPPEAARHLAAEIAGARLELVPGVGHLFLAEKPGILYERATQFFLGLPAG